MGCFKHIALLKAPQAFEIPHVEDVSDLTEICCLAAFVEQDVETVSIPVQFYDPRAFADFERYLATHPVDLVGISSMTGAFNTALRLAKTAKEHGAYVVLGGYHPSAMPREVLASPYVDAVVIGEGDLTFRDLVLHGPSRSVKGLAFKEDGGVVINGPRELIEDLDALPLPLRRARPVRAGEAGDAYTIDTVYTSRGCFRRCAFCANDLVNKRWRARSPENVVAELASLHDRRRRKLIKIWDANFMTDIRRVEAICDLMLREGLTGFRLWTETSVSDIVRAEHIMPKLFRAGLRAVSLGVESPHPETLKLMNKKGNIDQCAQAVEILNRHNIKPQGYFIIGNYNETEEDTRRYPEYAEELGLRHAIFMVMTPYPGTQVFEEFKQRGLIRSYDWDLYNNFAPVVATQGMDQRTLKTMYARCWGRFYLQRYLMQRSGTFHFCFSMLGLLLPLHAFCRVDKSNSPDDVLDYLFEVLRAGVGNDLAYRSNKRPPRLLRRFGTFAVRFVKKPGEAIELSTAYRDGVTYFSVRETRGVGLIPGPTFRLDEVIRLSEYVRPERLVMLILKAEIARMRRRGRLARALMLCRDGDLGGPALAVVGSALRHMITGLASLLAWRLLRRGARRADVAAPAFAGPPGQGKRAVAMRAVEAVEVGPGPGAGQARPRPEPPGAKT